MDLTVKPHVAAQAGVSVMPHNGILLLFFFLTLKAHTHKFTHIMFRKYYKFFRKKHSKIKKSCY